MLKRILFQGILLFISIIINAQEFYVPGKPYAFVNDYTDLFADKEEAYLNRKFQEYQDTTSTQIFVVTLNGEQDLPIDQMGFEIAESWAIGAKGKDNGLLILIYPNERQVNIQTGYGLEGALPDAILKRIIETEIKPSFREGRYSEGIDKATDVMISLLGGEYTGEQYMQNQPGEIVFVIIFLVIMALAIIGGISKKGKSSSIGKNLPLWLILSMLSSGRSSHGGSWGGFSGGGGRGGFGGFSGGGGGRFGGGGASGSW